MAGTVMRGRFMAGRAIPVGLSDQGYPIRAIRQSHLEQLRTAAVHQEPPSLGQIGAVERREARAEDRLSFDALRLQRQARP